MTIDDFNIISGDLDHTPEVSELMDGLAYHQFQHSVEYLNDTLGDITTSLAVPGLKFVGCKTTTPFERYRRDVTSNTGVTKKGKVDILNTSIYEIVANLDHNGEHIRVPVHVLDIDRGGVFEINSVNYITKPVLTDPVFSVMGTSVLAKTLKNKLTIESHPYSMKKHKDGEVFDVEVGILSGRHLKDSGVGLLPIALYSMWKHGDYGMNIGTFAEYEKMKDKDDYIALTAYEHPYTDIERGVIYIHKDDYSPKLDPMAAALLYLYTAHSQDMLNYIDHKYMIEMLIGMATYRQHNSNPLAADSSKSIEEIEKTIGITIDTISTQLDIISKRRLEDEGVIVADYIDALEWLVLNHGDIFANTTDTSDKYLDVIYYLMYHITTKFNKNMLKLRDISGKTKLTTPIVRKTLATHYVSETLRLVSGTTRNITVEIASCPNDNIYLTCGGMELQDRASNVSVASGRSRQNAVMPSSAYDVLIGSILNPTKSFQSPMAHWNMFLRVDVKTGKILISPEDKRRVKLLQQLIDVKEYTME